MLQAAEESLPARSSCPTTAATPEAKTVGVAGSGGARLRPRSSQQGQGFSKERAAAESAKMQQWRPLQRNENLHEDGRGTPLRLLRQVEKPQTFGPPSAPQDWACRRWAEGLRTAEARGHLRRQLRRVEKRQTFAPPSAPQDWACRRRAKGLRQQEFVDIFDGCCDESKIRRPSLPPRLPKTGRADGGPRVYGQQKLVDICACPPVARVP